MFFKFPPFFLKGIEMWARKKKKMGFKKGDNPPRQQNPVGPLKPSF